jgi:hypothetical protein
MPSKLPIAPRKPEVVFPVLHLPRLELCFADGSMLWLRQVNTDPLTRSLDHQGEALQVDLREISPLLEDEVFAAAEHDRPGIIFFTLRQHFKTACDFVQAVLALHQPARSQLA